MPAAPQHPSALTVIGSSAKVRWTGYGESGARRMTPCGSSPPCPIASTPSMPATRIILTTRDRAGIALAFGSRTRSPAAEPWSTSAALAKPPPSGSAPQKSAPTRAATTSSPLTSRTPWPTSHQRTHPTAFPSPSSATTHPTSSVSPPTSATSVSTADSTATLASFISPRLLSTPSTFFPHSRRTDPHRFSSKRGCSTRRRLRPTAPSPSKSQLRTAASFFPRRKPTHHPPASLISPPSPSHSRASGPPTRRTSTAAASHLRAPQAQRP